MDALEEALALLDGLICELGSSGSSGSSGSLDVPGPLLVFGFDEPVISFGGNAWVW